MFIKTLLDLKISMLWVLKSIVSLKLFYGVPTTKVLMSAKRDMSLSTRKPKVWTRKVSTQFSLTAQSLQANPDRHIASQGNRGIE